ncbi:glucosyltransferase MdoH [Acetobacter malorum DSM 14337]|uniref:Glucans biosynthesis glucosyltransferase H n=1 Tax=Acetobacter malorum DSM 14337 TaxID=1307910 RepID=A0ABQ0PYJ1_9PROT|nr:glycosyltransferase family 2 protein [Acetobacter malorum]KXV06792.1 hypothetical protein AD930_06755 [Acetobacter malorum]GBQ84747.1 glucosyltransferase MdoH [Acetobacter malorum DSM 14337]
MPPSLDDLDRARRKRVIILNILTASLSLTTAALSMLWMFVYNVSPWLFVPLITVSTILGFVASSYLFSTVFGLWDALRPASKDPLNPTNYAVQLRPETRVAVVVPVYNEDARRVCASVTATMSEMQEYPEIDQFDWILLSDSRKEDVIAQEKHAVYVMNDMFPNARIAYRNRVVNGDAKVGNMDDFLRRWGNSYDFMIVFDADTIMPGKTAIDLARTMQGNDRIGIIQGISYEVNSKTLFGRIKSFGHNIGIVIGTAAQNHYRLNRATFYGHGAILNVRAMQEHCNLPRFNKKGPFAAGKPTSHDYIEAMLLEGAGYECWRMHHFPSFDDQLHNIIDVAKRETRWMYGALDWLRIFMLQRLTMFGKTNLLMSTLNYFNAIIGMVFFIMSFVGFAYMLHHPLRTKMIIAKFSALGPVVLSLFLVMIFLPLGANLLYHYKTRNLHRYGGPVKLIWSSFLVMANGWLTSATMMIIVNTILVKWATGKKMVWGSQNREGRTVTWSEAFAAYTLSSVFGILLAVYIWKQILPYATPGALHRLGISPFWILFWMGPPVVGLIFSPVVSRFTSQRFPLMEKMGWAQDQFECEHDMPPEGQVLLTTRKMNEHFDQAIPENFSMEEAIRSPYFAMRHLLHLPARPAKTEFWKKRLAGKRFRDLTRTEKMIVFRTGGLWELYMREEMLAR